MRPSRLLLYCRSFLVIAVIVNVFLGINFITGILNAYPKDPLMPGRGVHIFNIDHARNVSNKCVDVFTSPNVIICIHDPAKDVYISKFLDKGIPWEGEIVGMFRKLLDTDPDMGVLDLGANVGQYSLLAAKMDHPVIAVEALPMHVDMLAQSIVLNYFKDRILLIHNAILDRHTRVRLVLSSDNQGATHINVSGLCEGCFYDNEMVDTITLDDLLPFISFTKVLLKIDVEGSEVDAIRGGREFFRGLYVPFVLMEWLSEIQRGLLMQEQDNYNELVDLMTGHLFRPFDYNRRPLVLHNWKIWPKDVMWIQHNVTFF